MTNNFKVLIMDSENLFHLSGKNSFAWQYSDVELDAFRPFQRVTGREKEVILLGRGFEKLCEIFSSNRETIFYGTDVYIVEKMQKKHPLMLIGFYFRHEYGMPYPNKDVFYYESEKGRAKWEYCLKFISESLFVYSDWDMRDASMTNLVKFLNKPEQPTKWQTTYREVEIAGDNEHMFVYFYRDGILQKYENWAPKIYQVYNTLYKKNWGHVKLRIDCIYWKEPFWYFIIGAKSEGMNQPMSDCMEVVCANEDFSEYFLKETRKYSHTFNHENYILSLNSKI